MSESGNELLLCLLGIVALLLGLLAAVEFLSRRWRYFWSIERNHKRLLPEFNQGAMRLQGRNRSEAH